MVDQNSREAELASILSADSPDDRKKLWMRPVLWLALGIGGVVLTLSVWFADTSGGVFKYKTETIARGDLVISVTATGTVEPTNVVDVSSELSGIIKTVLVEHNDQVVAGQTLAILNTDKLEAKVRRSRALLASREAKAQEIEVTVSERRQSYERAKSLQSKQATSQKVLDTAKAAFERILATQASAKADIAIAQADLFVSETNLSKGTITSPIEGIILKRNAESGKTVASSLQAPVLFLVAQDLKKMELRVDIDEADIGNVHVGAKANFRVEAYPERTFQAQIHKLHLAAEKVGGVVTYKAILTVDNSSLVLRPGMTATAEITTGEVNDALLIPNAALRFKIPSTSAKSGTVISSFMSSLRRRKPQQGRGIPPSKNGVRKVLVIREGVPVTVKIQTGESDGRHTQVLSGKLALDDKIVVAIIRQG